MKCKFLDALSIRLFEKPFRKLTMHDREWVGNFCTADAGISDHVHFVTMFLFQQVYGDSFRKYAGCVIKKPNADNGKLYCQYPIGAPDNRKKAVKKIVRIYSKQYKEIVFFAASDDNLEELKQIYGDRVVNVEMSRDSQNYILDTSEQLNLEGSRFADRRNKLRGFDKRNNWTYEIITKENMDECMAVNASWYTGHEKTSGLDGEQISLATMFKYYDQFDCQGGLLRIDGKAVAFCIGYPFNKEIHMGLFMKASREYGYTTIFLLQEFIKRNCTEYRYINGSADMGIPGLRSYKTSLRPKFMTSFYLITINSLE